MSYRDILQAEFHSRSTANHAYSLRAYARDLGLSPAMLSEVMANRRQLSAKKAADIARRLGLSESEQALFVALVKQGSRKSSRLREEGVRFLEKVKSSYKAKQLTLNHFKLISDWYYYAILTVMELDHYDGSAEFVAHYLNLDVSLVEDAIEVLRQLELVTKTKKGYVSLETDVSTPTNVTSIALKKFHRQGLQQALDAIDKVAVHERDITSMTMSIDRNKIPQAKKLIAKFRRDICRYLESGKKNSIYKLNIQLFPIGGTEK